jgi:hypothetical protein
MVGIKHKKLRRNRQQFHAQSQWELELRCRHGSLFSLVMPVYAVFAVYPVKDPAKLQG